MANIVKVFQGLTCRVAGHKHFYPLQRCFSTKPEIVKEEIKEAGEDPNVHEVIRGLPYHPTNFDKRVLVFVKRFKSVEDVPNSISHATMEKAKNSARIKICNYMIVMTIIGCIGTAISGRMAVERGESLQQMNLDWHKEMNKK